MIRTATVCSGGSRQRNVKSPTLPKWGRDEPSGLKLTEALNTPAFSGAERCTSPSYRPSVPGFGSSLRRPSPSLTPSSSWISTRCPPNGHSAEHLMPTFTVKELPSTGDGTPHRAMLVVCGTTSQAIMSADSQCTFPATSCSGNVNLHSASPAAVGAFKKMSAIQEESSPWASDSLPLTTSPSRLTTSTTPPRRSHSPGHETRTTTPRSAPASTSIGNGSRISMVGWCRIGGASPSLRTVPIRSRCSQRHDRLPARKASSVPNRAAESLPWPHQHSKAPR